MKKVLIIGNGMMGNSLKQALEKVGKYEVYVTNDVDLFQVYNFDVVFNCTGQVFSYQRIEDLGDGKVKMIDISSFQHKQYENNGLYSFQDVIFCHPLCGSEKSGRENAKADLFENETCIITTEGKGQELIDLAIEIFNDIGMIVHLCGTVEEHNKNLAYTSHLLHYLAFNGFADLHPVLTRLSHSNKEMWEGIFKANKKNIDEALLKFTYNLALCFHNQGIQASIRELVKDIPEHFYGTALKQLLK